MFLSSIYKINLSTSHKVCNLRHFSHIKVTRNDSVKTVILANPQTRNVLSLSMLKELREAMMYDDPNLRCIILKAEGKVFSAGHNLKELVDDTGKEHHHEIFKECSELMLSLMELPLPVIAQVNGIAAAAGCQLVASCDIILASDTSSFLTPGANFGIFCSTPGIPLVRNVPPKVAAYMLLTGLPITAQEALNAGLVSAVVSQDDLEKETQKCVAAICSKSKSVLTLGKKFMYEQMKMTLEDAYKFGGELMVKNVNMKDGQEGIKSFIQKRKPNWTHETV